MLKMSNQIIELSYIGTTNSDLDLPNLTLPNLFYINTSNIISVGFMIYTQYEANINIEWGDDNSSTVLVELHVNLAGTSSHFSSVVKGSYLRIFVSPTSLPCVVRLNSLFFY